MSTQRQHTDEPSPSVLEASSSRGTHSSDSESEERWHPDLNASPPPSPSPPHGPVEDNGDPWHAFGALLTNHIAEQAAIRSQRIDNHQRNVRRRVESQPPRANICLHLGGTGSSMPEPPLSPPLTPTSNSPACGSTPPTLECPICMKPLVDQMATWCGHVFCEVCIRAAIAVQAKCPVCRRKASQGELRRIYFS